MIALNVAWEMRCIRNVLPRYTVRNGRLLINPVGVEKVTELTLVSANAGTYKQNRVPDALDRHTRRLAAYDGTTPPFGVAVLLLPHRRSGSREPSVTFDRPIRQL